MPYQFLIYIVTFIAKNVLHVYKGEITFCFKEARLSIYSPLDSLYIFKNDLFSYKKSFNKEKLC